VEISPTPAHQALLAAAALRLESAPFLLASQTLTQLASTEATNVAYHLLASQLALKRNHGDRAEQHLQKAVALEPTNRLHQINLATLRLQARRTEVVQAAHQELEGWASDPEWGLTVLRTLVADALVRSNAPAALGFSARLLAQPHATFADRLQDASAAWLAAEASLPQRVQALQQAAGTNAVFVTQVAWWLNHHGQAANTLDWLASQSAELRQQPVIGLAEAEALLLTRRWADLEERFSSQKWDEQDFLRLAYLARALREQGRHTVATAHWERAGDAVGRRPERAAGLVQLAFNWNWIEEALTLLWRWAREQPREDWPLQQLTRHYSLQAQTEGLCQVHEELRRRQPDSLPIKNNYAMLCLLLRRDLVNTRQLAQEVYQAAPTNGIFASTYALALYLGGDSAGAQVVLQRLPEAEQNRPEVTPYAALFQAVTGGAGVRAQLEAAARSASLPEERALFEAALR
jgi:hypothetical protein